MCGDSIVFLLQCLIERGITSLCISLKRKTSCGAAGPGTCLPTHPRYPFHRKRRGIDSFSLPVAWPGVCSDTNLPHFLKVPVWDLIPFTWRTRPNKVLSIPVMLDCRSYPQTSRQLKDKLSLPSCPSESWDSNLLARQGPVSICKTFICL